jgi:hypothetical protein
MVVQSLITRQNDLHLTINIFVKQILHHIESMSDSVNAHEEAYPLQETRSKVKFAPLLTRSIQSNVPLKKSTKETYSRHEIPIQSQALVPPKV